MARPEKLDKMVDYSPSSVVSREIAGSDTGTVTLFAFDAGQGLSEHTAPFDALVYAVEGSADVTVDGETFPVTGGDVLTMPAGRPHSLRASGKFKMMLVMLRKGQ